MLENEFIPYEQALELKELGFDEMCYASYTDKNKFNTNGFFYRIIPSPEKTCIAPLYQQVFKWFREKHNLPSEVRFVTNLKVYDYRITKIDILYNNSFYDGIKPCNAYITYEKAELACLKKLIEIIKRK